MLHYSAPEASSERLLKWAPANHWKDMSYLWPDRKGTWHIRSHLERKHKLCKSWNIYGCSSRHILPGFIVCVFSRGHRWFPQESNCFPLIWHLNKGLSNETRRLQEGCRGTKCLDSQRGISAHDLSFLVTTEQSNDHEHVNTREDSAVCSLFISMSRRRPAQCRLRASSCSSHGLI